jgi:hypothetical protein
MAFCEDCPLRGKCVGEIDTLEYREVSGRRFGSGAFFAAFAALRDIRGGLSRIFYMPTDLSPEAILKQVDDCEYPAYQTKGLIRKRQVPECRALGEYACNGKDQQIENLAQQAMSMPVQTRSV